MGLWSFLFGDNKEKEMADKQHVYDLKYHQWEINQRDDDFQFRLDQHEIDKWNAENVRNYKNETAINDWKYREAMREFDLKNQIEAYNASLDTYERQMDYNGLAAELSSADHTRKYNEQLVSIGFKHEDLLMKHGFQQEAATRDIQRKKATTAGKLEDLKLQSIQKQGEVRNLGQTGRSAQKNVISVMAQFANQQGALVDAIARDEGDYAFGQRKAAAELNKGGRELHESMKSAQLQHAANQEHVLLQKYSADMAAENQIAPAPKEAPQLPAPLNIPETKIVAPKPPGADPPRPIKQAISKQGFLSQLLSDDRTKRTYNRVGTSPTGVPIYTFRYIHDGEHGPWYKGTSAQDLISMGRTDAVVQKEKDGFYYVDYSKLDVDFEKVQVT